MMSLLNRVYQKYCRTVFWLTHKLSFKTLGQGAYLVKPFRVDGGNNISIENGTFFQRGVWLYCCGIDDLHASLSVGEGCIFGYNNHITSIREVKICDYVLTGNNVYISDNIHEYEDTTSPVMHQSVRFKRPVVIGTGAWIGENVSIIGASIGKNSVIGANSVVTRDIPDYSVAVGAPAIVIRQFDFELKKWVDKRNLAYSIDDSNQTN
jgi:acetyltransferase-like isoleucine patch superfamily enzyme